MLSKNTPRLPLNSCEDLLLKVTSDYHQLCTDWSTYKTLDFVLSANHLYKDWIDKAGSIEQKQRKHNAGKNLKDVFHCIGDLANATKHWRLDKSNQSRQIVDQVSSPAIADWHAYFVTGPVIYVDILDSRLSMPELTRITLKCLEWLIHNSEACEPLSLEQEIAQLFQKSKIAK